MQVDRSFWQGQRLDVTRYALIPRTLTFIRRGERILLLQLASGAWAGRYNGVGGHIERGEDPRTAAVREVREETGLQVQNVRLCGVVAVDAGPEAGIGLYVFMAHSAAGEIHSGLEGNVAWFTQEQIGGLPVVHDLPFLLPQAVSASEAGTTFSAAYRMAPGGELEIVLGE